MKVIFNIIIDILMILLLIILLPIGFLNYLWKEVRGKHGRLN